MLEIDKALLKEVVFGVCFFSVLYQLAILLNVFLGRSYLNVMCKLDTYYPTINIFFVPYFLYYLHIFISPYFIGCKDKKLLDRYTTILIISSTIGFLFFLLFPTYIDRSMFKKDLYSFLYDYNRHGNACPSFHVLVTWTIWVNFRVLKIFKKLINIGLILTYSIVASTVFCRKHAIIDISVSIMIVEVVKLLTDRYNLDAKLFSFVKTNSFRYIKRAFYVILIIITIFLTICFSFVLHYYIKNCFLKENIKEVYVRDIAKEYKPKVTIIIPVYNRKKYLKECLDSCINQTMNDIEIIGINDGSTDGSLDILKEYAEKDDRFILIDKENTGLGATRNVGLEYASGEYIMFLDCDDRLKINACEIAYENIKNNKADIVSFGWSGFTDSDNWLYKKLSKFVKNYRNIKTKFFAEKVNLSYKLFKNCDKVILLENVLYEHRISKKICL